MLQLWNHERFRYSTEYRRLSPDERWWACVEKTDECWIFHGVPNAYGYGTIKVHGQTFLAHRYGYEMLIGEIPVGMQLDHLCRNRRCVNPSHLEPVSSRENTLRGKTLAAKQIKQTHCIRGHPLYGDNLRMGTGGKRVCRICNAMNSMLWRVEHNIASQRDIERLQDFGREAHDYAPIVES